MSRSASSQDSERRRLRVPTRRAGQRDRVGPGPAAPQQTSPPAATSRAGSSEGVAAGRRTRSGRSGAGGRADPPPAARSTTDDPRGPGRRLQRAGAPGRSRAKERRMRIAVGGEARHHLHHPRPLPEPLQVLPHPRRRAHDVEVVHLDQLAAPAVEEHHLAEGEQLERAPEARPGPARRAGDAPHLAVLAGVEVHEAVALPEGAPPDHHRAGLVERHVRTSGGSRTPGAPCRPCASPSARARSGPGRP